MSRVSREMARVSLSTMVRRVAVAGSLLLVLLLCAAPMGSQALTWDRTPAAPPQLTGAAAIQVEVSSRTLFARTLSAGVGGVAGGGSTCGSSSNSTRLLVSMGGSSSDDVDRTTLWLLAWPLASSRSGQQQWVAAPMVGAQPVARDTFGFATPGSGDTGSFAGAAFAYGGSITGKNPFYLTSLWVLDLETTLWTPLGPSRMVASSQPSAYTCGGKAGLSSGKLSYTTPSAADRTVDDCYYSATSVAQTDELGCAWPAGRIGHSLVVVDGALLLIGGALMDGTVVGEVWRLQLNAQLQVAWSQQASSTSGKYVYSNDQRRYIKNANAPGVMFNMRCPVQWQLLTRPDGTAAINGSATSAPYPPSRYLHSVAVSGSTLVVSGGRSSSSSTAALSDVWLLDTRNLVWTQLAIAASSSGLSPVARAFHAGFVMQIGPGTSGANLSALVSDPADAAVVACANQTISALTLVGGVDSSDNAINDVFIGVPVCASGSIASACNASIVDAAPLNWTWHRGVATMMPSSLEVASGNAWLQMGRQVLSVGGETNDGLVDSATLYDFDQAASAELPAPFSSAQLSTGTIPAGRMLHSSFLIRRLMYVLGGVGSSSTSLNQLWTYDVDRLSWSLVGAVSASSSMWPPFTQAALVAADPRTIYMYGGGTGGTVGNSITDLSPMTCNTNLYVFDTVTAQWTNLTTQVRSATRWNGTAAAATATGGMLLNGYIYPRARCGAVGAVLGVGASSALYMFGGELDSAGAKRSADNALWSLNLTSLEWTLRQVSNTSVADVATATQPTPRRLHTLLATGLNQLLLCFGLDYRNKANLVFASCWTYTAGSTNAWRWVTTQTNAPPQRFAAGVCVSSRRVIVSGGANLADSSLDDLYSLDLDRMIWSPLYPATGNQPTARSRHTLVAVMDAHEVLLYGGLTGDTFVHVLSMDEAAAGGGAHTNSLPHDWLASVQFFNGATDMSFPAATFPVGEWPAGASATSLLTISSAPFVFGSLASAMLYVQSVIGATSSVISLLDSESSYSVRTSRYIASVSIASNLTLVGTPRRSSSTTSTNGANGLPNRAVIECAGSTQCTLVADGKSAATVVSPTSSTGTSASSGSSRAKLVVLRDFTVRNAISSTKGGGLRLLNTQLTLSNVGVQNCSASTFGGGIALENSIIALDACDVLNNAAGQVGGGLYAVNVQLTITRSRFMSNMISAATSSTTFTTYGQGGALGLMSCILVVDTSTFEGNSARIGGALFAGTMQSEVVGAYTSLGVRSPTNTIHRSRFVGNAAFVSGGGLYFSRIDPVPVVDRCNFTANSATEAGGAVYLNAAQLSCNGSHFAHNVVGHAGGAVFWHPADSDTDWTNAPTFDGTALVELDTSTTTACGVDASLVVDYHCNAAFYGPFLASPAASLRFTSSGASAADMLQATGSVVTPAIQLILIDLYHQRVACDNSTYVSVRPLALFAGATSVQAVLGVISFDQLIVKAPPNTSVDVTFVSSQSLPFLGDDTTSGALALQLYMQVDFASGLQKATNESFAQTGSCSSACSYTLPAQDDAHVTTLTITFDTALFQHSYDQLIVYFVVDDVLQPFMTITGSQVLAKATRIVSDVSDSRSLVAGTVVVIEPSYSMVMSVPSASVTLSLQTGDDRAGYVTGFFNYSTECPPTLTLYQPTNTCLPSQQSSSITRNIMLGLAAVSMACVCVAAALFARYRHAPLFRATSVAFTGATLFCLMMMPIASVFFSLLPSANNNVVCLSRVWFATFGVVGVLLMLVVKAWRVSTIATANQLKPSAVTDRKMWAVVAAGATLQLALNIYFTAMPLSRSGLAVRGSPSYLVMQCELESNFIAWFSIELAFIGLLSLLAAYLSFQARGVPSQYNESAHVANALFLLVLCATILVPVAAVVQDQADVLVIVQGGGAATIAIMWTAVLFLPHFWQVLQTLRRAKKVSAERRRALAAAQITAAAMRPSRSKSGDTPGGMHMRARVSSGRTNRERSSSRVLDSPIEAQPHAQSPGHHAPDAPRTHLHLDDVPYPTPSEAAYAASDSSDESKQHHPPRYHLEDENVAAVTSSSIGPAGVVHSEHGGQVDDFFALHPLTRTPIVAPVLLSPITLHSSLAPSHLPSLISSPIHSRPFSESFTRPSSVCHSSLLHAPANSAVNDMEMEGEMEMSQTRQP